MILTTLIASQRCLYFTDQVCHFRFGPVAAVSVINKPVCKVRLRPWISLNHSHFSMFYIAKKGRNISCLKLLRL